MRRELTAPERAVLRHMVDGAAFDDDELVTSDDRARWRAQVDFATAGARCGCGTCPSITLDVRAGDTLPGRDRMVLSAATDGATLLLFIDDDRLSYLELAPVDGQVFAEFPDPTDIVA